MHFPQPRWLPRLLLCWIILSPAGAGAYDAYNGHSVAEHLTTSVLTPVLGVSTTTSYVEHLTPDSLAYARDDAAAFIASDGEIRGAQFERAVRQYRSDYPDKPLDDMDLAKYIVAKESPTTADKAK